VKSNLAISGAIVIGAISLAVAFYLVQVDKRESIERQQITENKRAELATKQKECESLSSGVKDQWNNVVGVTYDSEFWEECVVTYTDTKTGEIQTSPLRLMKDAK